MDVQFPTLTSRPSTSVVAPFGVRNVTPSSSSSISCPLDAAPLPIMAGSLLTGSTSITCMLRTGEAAAVAGMLVPVLGVASASAAAVTRAAAWSRWGAPTTSSNSPSRSMTALNDARDSSCECGTQSIRAASQYHACVHAAETGGCSERRVTGTFAYLSSIIISFENNDNNV